MNLAVTTGPTFFWNTIIQIQSIYNFKKSNKETCHIVHCVEWQHVITEKYDFVCE